MPNADELAKLLAEISLECERLEELAERFAEDARQAMRPLTVAKPHC